jgi:hypothetical protein
VAVYIWCKWARLILEGELAEWEGMSFTKGDITFGLLEKL